MIGKTILHYKITAKHDEGGMGVVYKARDTRLDRDVAIKFLPHHIAADAEARQRFEIEAKAAAALAGLLQVDATCSRFSVNSFSVYFRKSLIYYCCVV
jgi:serine/threonine protein kinase